MSATFGARLDAALDKRGPVCAGIDPHPELLEAWGLAHSANDGADRSVDGLARFADSCVEAFGASAAIVKPQSAFFEAYGAAGIAVLERTVAGCRQAGALVLLDVKRADIGSTMAAYARAYLDPAAPLAVDAITVNPYLGVGALDPAFDLCQRYGAGAFVLALTSNPEAAQLQRARGADGRIVAQVVIDELAGRNRGADPLGSLGVVVGATIGADTAGDAPRFDALNGPLLVPGIGAQGGTAGDVRRIFGDQLRAVVPSLSRELLRTGPDVATLRAALAAQNETFGFLRP